MGDFSKRYTEEFGLNGIFLGLNGIDFLGLFG
ncbi:MAG: hypothetical protein RLZZ628_3709, partial [Bacteroidota bacterium]